jgi:hypothetical protein
LRIPLPSFGSAGRPGFVKQKHIFGIINYGLRGTSEEFPKIIEEVIFLIFHFLELGG